jgi:hypothetical protein
MRLPEERTRWPTQVEERTTHCCQWSERATRRAMSVEELEQLEVQAKEQTKAGG